MKNAIVYTWYGSLYVFLILAAVRFVATALNACLAVPLWLKTVFSCCPSHFWVTLVVYSLSYNSFKCVKSAFLESVNSGPYGVWTHSWVRHNFQMLSTSLFLFLYWDDMEKVTLYLLTRCKCVLFDMEKWTLILRYVCSTFMLFYYLRIFLIMDNWVMI